MKKLLKKCIFGKLKIVFNFYQGAGGRKISSSPTAGISCEISAATVVSGGALDPINTGFCI